MLHSHIYPLQNNSGQKQLLGFTYESIFTKLGRIFLRLTIILRLELSGCITLRERVLEIQMEYM